MITLEDVQYYLLIGPDGGNTNVKASYLTPSGEIKDLTIPTTIAIAPSYVSELGSSKSVNSTDNLHILLKPIDTDGFVKGGYYFVGAAAKLAEDPIEPTEGVSKHDSQLHIITMLTAEAIAALDNGYEGKVAIPPSTGLPVKFVKDGARQAFLNRLKGSFEITFLDGLYKGKTITLVHIVDEDRPASAYIHAEATKAGLGLSFDIKNYELVENDVSEDISDPEKPYIVSDPGGVTFDIAVFEEDGINSSLTTTYTEVPEQFKSANLGHLVGRKVGGNHVVEALQEKVNKAIVQAHQEQGLPIFQETFFRNRAEFIDLILKPYTDELVDGVKSPKIIRSFGNAVNIDLTDIVVPALDEYGEIVFFLNMLTRQKASTIQNNMITGGGVLLGYKILRDRQKLANGVKLYELPPKKKIYIAPYINSRGYLIESFLNHPDIVEQIRKQKVAR
ncbi:hypothetical protein ABHN11_13170 [Brevibacillus centrosporus]|jgi:hypothetical protein|uniref:hypothetical protein n=1 Tax=Brevibacillus centrosporus TaxID=54910 RepID=UPI0039876163